MLWVCKYDGLGLLRVVQFGSQLLEGIFDGLNLKQEGFPFFD